MALKLITASTSEPITVAEAKDQARVTIPDDDAYITSLIPAVRKLAETLLQRSIMEQTWGKTSDYFTSALKLYMPPITSILSIKYLDVDGVERALDPVDYKLDNANDFRAGYVVPAFGKAWPATRVDINAVKVRYKAGHANAANVDESIKLWIKLHVAYFYDTREAALSASLKPIPRLSGLIDSFRIWD